MAKQNIRTKMKQRKQQYDKAKSSLAPEDWAAYRSIKSKITADINHFHTNYQNQLFDNKGHVSCQCQPIEGRWKGCNQWCRKADTLNNQFYSPMKI